MGKHDAIAEIERRRYEERMRYNAYVTGQMPKPPGSYHRALEHDGKPSLWRRLKLALLRWWVSERREREDGHDDGLQGAACRVGE